MGTVAVESKLGTYLHQIQGPARGVYQCEPATHSDLWVNYLVHREDLCKKINRNTTSYFALNQNDELVFNLKYATVICRAHYLRVPKPLPNEEDIEGLGQYWKTYYNTKLGKDSVKKFVDEYQVYCQ